MRAGKHGSYGQTLKGPKRGGKTKANMVTLSETWEFSGGGYNHITRHNGTWRKSETDKSAMTHDVASCAECYFQIPTKDISNLPRLGARRLRLGIRGATSRDGICGGALWGNIAAIGDITHACENYIFAPTIRRLLNYIPTWRTITVTANAPRWEVRRPTYQPESRA